MNFSELVKILKGFELDKELIDEKELETKLQSYLKSKNLTVDRQYILHGMRNDLIVFNEQQKYCLELKKFADKSCMRQLDRYIGVYKDGIILVCWKASKNVREVFKQVKQSIVIPIELIEIRNQQAML